MPAGRDAEEGDAEGIRGLELVDEGVAMRRVDAAVDADVPEALLRAPLSLYQLLLDGIEHREMVGKQEELAVVVE